MKRSEQTMLHITDKNIEKFRAILIETEKSKNTIEKYVRDIRKFKKHIRNKNLNKEIVLSYKKEMEQSGQYRITSINSYLISLNQFFRCMGCPEFCVKTIKVQRTVFEAEEKELTMEEYRKLVNVANQMGDEETALVLQTIAGTGIRIGELEHIRVESLAEGIVDVHNKGKVRRILLPSKLIPLLAKYARKKNRITGPVFCNHKGNPTDRKTIWRRMKKVAVHAKIPRGKVFPHNLRHLFAKEFYQQTGDIMKLADILGHSNINTTRIYIRSTGIEHKKQIDAMHMIIMENKMSEKSQSNSQIETQKIADEMPDFIIKEDTIIIKKLSKLCVNDTSYEIIIRKNAPVS